jgi:hypothetical protein
MITNTENARLVEKPEKWADDRFLIERLQAQKRENKMFWKYNTKSRTLDKLPDTSKVKRFYLQPAVTWQIDRMGNLFIPVSSAEGFHMIKLSIAPKQ